MRALGGTQFNMTGVLTGRRKFRHHRQLQIGECYINTQRDTNTEGRCPCEDRGCYKPKNTWGYEKPESKEGSSVRSFEGSMGLPIP